MSEQDKDGSISFIFHMFADSEAISKNEPFFYEANVFLQCRGNNCYLLLCVCVFYTLDQVSGCG